MLVEVHGIKRNRSFTTKDGNTISGTNIYVEHPENGVEGCMCEKYFLNSNSFDASKITVGVMLDLEFNRFGKISNFRFHDEKK